MQVAGRFLGHGARPANGLGVEPRAVAERGESLVVDLAHLEPHVRDLVELGRVAEDPSIGLLADAAATKHLGLCAHLLEPGRDARPAATGCALLRGTKATIHLGELGLRSLGLLLGQAGDRELLLERCEEPARFGELGRLVAGVHPRGEAEVAGTDHRGSTQLVHVRRRQRQARRARVVDSDVRSTLVVGDDDAATEDIEVRELGAGDSPDGGALQRLGQALPLGGVEPAEHGHPVVEADTEHLPAARNYQFVNAHGSPLKSLS